MENNLKTKIEYIVLSLCTYKRPNILRECLNSISKLKLPENIKVELLVIDNDELSSAKSLLDEYRDILTIPVHYFTETKRGLSNARNRLITEVMNLKASHIAMFDDDILLPEDWLMNYVNYYNSNPDAVILTSASYSKFTEKPPEYIEKNDLFKCSTTKKTGSVRKDCASGNVFFPTTLMSLLNLSFNSEYVFMGGEDGKFFEEASKKGAVIVWCKEAYNWELNGADKINIGWIIKRSHYNGFSAGKGAVSRKKSFGKLLYIIRQFFSFIVNSLILPFSILLGFTAFVNMLGFVSKSFGRLQGAIQTKPLNYYEKIYGN